MEILLRQPNRGACPKDNKGLFRYKNMADVSECVHILTLTVHKEIYLVYI